MNKDTGEYLDIMLFSRKVVKNKAHTAATVKHLCINI